MIDAIPIGEIPECPTKYIDVRDARVSTAFLLPSYTSDISVRAFLHNGAPRASYAAPALAAAIFLTSVRGLPLDEVSVETPRGEFFVQKAAADSEYGVLLPKCKVLRAKTLEFAACIEVVCYEVLTARGVVRVLECSDAMRYSQDVLALFARGDGGENVCATVAVSLSDGILRMRSHTVSSVENADLYSLVCGLSVLAERSPSGFPFLADLSGVVFSAESVGDMLRISTPASFMTLPLPEI